MTSVTDLRDVVIGVDPHVHTHSAAALDARTGGVLNQITVEATADGYAHLVEFATSTRGCVRERSRARVDTAPV
jgi:transposase